LVDATAKTGRSRQGRVQRQQNFELSRRSTRNNESNTPSNLMNFMISSTQQISKMSHHELHDIMCPQAKQLQISMMMWAST
jgi:hypothetical protein